MARKPLKIDKDFTEALRNELAFAGQYPLPKGYELYVTDTVRGRCSYTQKSLTVPMWAIKKSWAYALYYACHEIAHILAPATKGDVHGSKFMAAFMRTCPEHLQHYELKYKPRLAAAAGISKKESR